MTCTFAKHKNHGRTSGSFNEREVAALETIIKYATKVPALSYVCRAAEYSAIVRRINRMKDNVAANPRRSPRVRAIDRVAATLRTTPEGVMMRDLAAELDLPFATVMSALQRLRRHGEAKQIRRSTWVGTSTVRRAS